MEILRSVRPALAASGLCRLPLLDAAAASMSVTTRKVARAWLLQRSPNIFVVVGTLSIEHFRDNLKATALELSLDSIARLDKVAAAPDSQE
ncbi:MAG: aldo/keto reductase [Methylocystis silviterrae]